MPILVFHFEVIQKFISYQSKMNPMYSLNHKFTCDNSWSCVLCYTSGMRADDCSFSPQESRGHPTPKPPAFRWVHTARQKALIWWALVLHKFKCNFYYSFGKIKWVLKARIEVSELHPVTHSPFQPLIVTHQDINLLQVTSYYFITKAKCQSNFKTCIVLLCASTNRSRRWFWLDRCCCLTSQSSFVIGINQIPDLNDTYRMSLQHIRLESVYLNRLSSFPIDWWL